MKAPKRALRDPAAVPPPGPPWDQPIEQAALAFLDLEMTGLDVDEADGLTAGSLPPTSLRVEAPAAEVFAAGLLDALAIGFDPLLARANPVTASRPTVAIAAATRTRRRQYTLGGRDPTGRNIEDEASRGAAAIANTAPASGK